MRYLVAALAIVAAGLAVGLLHHDTDPAAALRIAFVCGDHVDEIDLAGGHRHTLRSGARVEGSPAVSPDGKQRAVSVLSPNGQKAQLWVVDVDGSGRRQLTSGAYDILPEWSPDGSTILFTRFAQLGFEAETTKSWLETMPAIGGTPHRLTSSGYDGGGAYSPDGRTIAFASARDKAAKLRGEDECRHQSQLYLMRPDGSGAHRVTSDFLGDASPVFASTTTIVYSRAPATTYDSELYRIDVDGSCRIRLTHDALTDVLPAILPGPARELAERELRSFSASAGEIQPGQPLPAPPEGILGGLPCQPPAISGAPLPAHP